MKNWDFQPPFIFTVGVVVGVLIASIAVFILHIRPGPGVPVKESVVVTHRKMYRIHVHAQESPSTTWTISHDFDSIDTLCEFHNPSHQQIFPDALTLTDSNAVTVAWVVAQAGRATCWDTASPTGKLYEGKWAPALPCTVGDLYWSNYWKSLKSCRTEWRYAKPEDWRRYWEIKTKGE